MITLTVWEGKSVLEMVEESCFNRVKTVQKENSFDENCHLPSTKEKEVLLMQEEIGYHLHFRQVMKTAFLGPK